MQTTCGAKRRLHMFALGLLPCPIKNRDTKPIDAGGSAFVFLGDYKIEGIPC